MKATVGVLGVSLAVALLLAEMTVRWLEPQPLQHIQLDDALYFVNQPAARFTYARAGEYSIPVTFNAWGFRGPVPGTRAAPGTLRILLVGDSQTEGLQVAFDQTYGSVLRRELEAALPGRRVEVVNLAVSAYGTHQELLTLKRYGERVKPDWVILGFYPDNDLADNVRLPLVTEDAGGVRLVAHRFSPLHRLVLGTKVSIARMSHLYVFTTVRLKALVSTPLLSQVGILERRAPSIAVVDPAPSEESRRAYRMTEALVRMTRAEAHRLGSELLVLTIPSKVQVTEAATSGAADMDRLERTFVEAFDRGGVPHVEAVAALREAHQRGRRPYFVVDGHLNAVGHQVIGETLARWLAPRVGQPRRQYASDGSVDARTRTK